MNESKTVSLDISLRPLRLAFLVNPKDKKAISYIFDLNACLWGGKYNAIIPKLSRMPDWWKNSVHMANDNPQSILAGYLKAFEPDFLISAGKPAKRIPFPAQRIIELSSLIDEKGRLICGLDVLNLFEKLYDERFRFAERNPEKFILPQSSSSAIQKLLAASMGCFSERFGPVRESYVRIFSPHEVEIKPDGFLAALQSYTTPFDVGSWGLTERSQIHREGLRLFVMDPSSEIDLIDFWNLKAFGYEVYPVPNEWAAEMVDGCADLINQDQVRWASGDHRFVSIIYSRTTSDMPRKAFFEPLSSKCKRPIHTQSYPVLWSTGFSSSRCSVSAADDHFEVAVEDRRISFEPKQPDFKCFFTLHHEQFANVIKIRDYASGRDGTALVIPPDYKNVGDLLSFGVSDSTFAGTEGLVTLCRYSSSGRERWTLPDGLSLFSGWLSQRHIEVAHSGAGRIANQMMRALGGPQGAMLIAHEELIQKLNSMAHAAVEEEIDVADGSAVVKSKVRRSVISHKQLIGLLQKINSDRHGVAANHLKALLRSQVFRVGLQLKCDHCTQSNWYALSELKESLRCDRCLMEFDFPLAEPPQHDRWCYRTQGPFSVENYAQGSYCVALTLRFFSERSSAEASWVTNIELEGPPIKGKIEIDAAIWRRRQYWGGSKASLVLCECKSFGKFTQRDFQRARILRRLFPEAVLLFATLRNELSPAEKRALSAIARSGPKFPGVRLRAHVAVLTGKELFSERGIPYCWGEDDQRLYSNDDIQGLCDVTQRLHLGMEPRGDSSISRQELPPPHIAAQSTKSNSN